MVALICDFVLTNDAVITFAAVAMANAATDAILLSPEYRAISASMPAENAQTPAPQTPAPQPPAPHLKAPPQQEAPPNRAWPVFPILLGTLLLVLHSCVHV